MRSDGEIEMLDRQVLREAAWVTGGVDAHHAESPDEAAMRHEEESSGKWAERERDALREEIFSAVCAYTVAEGVHPREVTRRMEALMRRFGQATLRRMCGAREWWEEAAVREVCRAHDEARLRAGGEDIGAFLLSVSKKVREEADEAFVYASFQGLCRFWECDGRSWRSAAAVHYALLKTLRPHLLAVMANRNGADVPVMMSLDDIAILCGDAGKATVSARVKRIFNRRLEAGGMGGCFAHFQKSAEAVERYRAAQMGNTNRKRRA